MPSDCSLIALHYRGGVSGGTRRGLSVGKNRARHRDPARTGSGGAENGLGAGGHSANGVPDRLRVLFQLVGKSVVIGDRKVGNNLGHG